MLVFGQLSLTAEPWHWMTRLMPNTEITYYYYVILVHLQLRLSTRDLYGMYSSTYVRLTFKFMPILMSPAAPPRHCDRPRLCNI